MLHRDFDPPLSAGVVQEEAPPTLGQTLALTDDALARLQSFSSRLGALNEEASRVLNRTQGLPPYAPTLGAALTGLQQTFGRRAERLTRQVLGVRDDQVLSALRTAGDDRRPVPLSSYRAAEQVSQRVEALGQAYARLSSVASGALRAVQEGRDLEAARHVEELLTALRQG